MITRCDHEVHLVRNNTRRLPLRLDLSLPLRAPLVLQLLAHVAVNVVASSDWDSIAEVADEVRFSLWIKKNNNLAME